jgi:hypothetical protein
MFQSNVWHGFGRIEVGSCHARCSTSWVATNFFRKAVAFVVCFMHAKVGSHLGIFECPVFFVVFFLLCLCMHDIHNMHDHALCFSVDTNVAKLVCITFMKHACMHASSTSCMWLGDIWLRLVL